MKDFPYYQINSMFRLESITILASQIRVIKKTSSNVAIYLHDSKSPINVSTSKNMEEITNLWVQALHAEQTMTSELQQAWDGNKVKRVYIPFPASDADTEDADAGEKEFTSNTMQDVDDALELSLEGDAPTQTLNNETTTEPACDNNDNG